MSECFYDTDEGEFVDFATLEDWEIQDKKKDARIEELERKYRLIAGDKIDLRSELASAQGRIKELDNHCRDLEAKLADAEWLLLDAMTQLEEGKIKTRRNRASLIQEFLAELKGGDR